MAQQAADQDDVKRVTTADRLDQVLKAQEQRAIACTKWEKQFRRLLNEEISDEDYLETVQSLMNEFQDVSNAMNEIADIFDGKNLKKLSKKIRRLQEFEKQKMNITIAMQQKIVTARPPKKENHHEHKNDCQHKDPMIWRPRLYKEKQEFAIIIEQINDLLAEIKEIKNDLKTSQQIFVQGPTIKIQTADDCKTQNLINGKSFK